MAIAFANLGTSANPDISSGTDATSYANSSWTPPTSGLIICFVIAKRAAALDTPTISGNSLTWTQIGSTLNCGGSNHGLSLFAADAAGSSTGATTVSFGANTQIHCSASFFHATGVDLSGGVAAAFVQTVTATGTGTTGTVTLAAAANSNNRPVAGFFHAQNEAKTPRANWTEIDDLAGSSGIRNLETQYRDDAFETTSTATWATSDNWGGMAAELKAEIAAMGSASALSTATLAFVSLTGLRGFWPLNSFDQSGNAYDISGHVHTLTYTGNPTYNIDPFGAGYLDLDGTGDYLNIADTAALDILGSESYVASGVGLEVQGLTYGCWVYLDSTSGTPTLMAKYTDDANGSYRLSLSGAQLRSHLVLSSGISTYTSSTLNTGQWYFVVARFERGNVGYHHAVFINGSKAEAGVSATPTIANSSVAFTIGASAAGADPLNGRIAFSFICCEALTDAVLDQLYEDSWPLFSPNIDGTLAKTLGALTATGTGTVAVAGSLAKTLGALTGAGAGTVATGGTLAKALGALTSTGAGAVALTGTLAKTLGNLTLVSLGAGAGIQGNLNQTLGALTLVSTGTVEIAGTLAKTLGALALASAGLTVEYRTYIITDGLAFNDTGQPVAPILVSTDTLTFTETIKAPLIVSTDTLTFTDTPVVTVAPIVITDTLTFDELLTVTGVTVTPPATAATGGLDSNHVLRLLYGNDKRNPTRTLDIAQSAPGHIFLLKGGGFAPGAGELNELWSGESIRHHGQKKLAESRKNSTLSITYDLSSGSMAGLSAVQREISRFFLEAKLQQVSRQGEKVWLEYRWADNLNSLPTPTFGQLSSYYEVYAAKSPKWPDNLHDGNLNAGEIDGVTVELTCSPAPEGLKQRAANATGAISLHTHGVLIASGASSKLHWSSYTNSGLTGNFTITGWITHNATWSSGTKDIFDYYVSASNRIRIQYDRSNTRWVITKIVSGTTFTANSSSDSVASGDHNHLILVQDDTTLHLYINGVEVASVTATNTMSQNGTIALGCPGTGSLDGVDVVLDGWRILPDDITATQALAIYTAELPIKQNSNRVGEPPYFWTEDGNSQVDNCDDTTRDNWGVIGGVGGDLEAKTDIRLQTPIEYSHTNFYYGIRAQDETYTPSSYIYHEVTTGTNVVDATASAGSYRQVTGTFSTTFYKLVTDYVAPKLLFGKYQLLARLKLPTTPVTITPKFEFATNFLDPIICKAVTFTGFNDWQLVDLGTVFITSEAANVIEAGTVPFGLRITIASSTSITAQCDFLALMPYPWARLSNSLIPSTATPFYVVAEDGRGYMFSDASGNRTQELHFEYRGDPLTVAPQKYNYLFAFQTRSSGVLTITDVATLTVYVTPRYLLPGGMVA